MRSNHYERFDGKGYPSGLKGEEIPLGARVVAICDSIDAMTSTRSYQKAHDFQYCYDEIKRNMGTMYDPIIAEHVLKHWDEVVKIVKQIKQNNKVLDKYGQVLYYFSQVLDIIKNQKDNRKEKMIMNDREQELMELMIQIEMIIRREMMGRFHSSRIQMNPHRGQGRIMSLLKLQQEISQKELSYLLDMSKQGLAELLGKLEMAGYIIRKPSTEDGRVMMIQLTEKGRVAAEEMEQKESGTDTVFSCLSEEEQSNLKKYLKKIIKNAQEKMPDDFSGRRRHRQGGIYSRTDRNF